MEALLDDAHSLQRLLEEQLSLLAAPPLGEEEAAQIAAAVEQRLPELETAQHSTSTATFQRLPLLQCVALTSAVLDAAESRRGVAAAAESVLQEKQSVAAWDYWCSVWSYQHYVLPCWVAVELTKGALWSSEEAASFFLWARLSLQQHLSQHAAHPAFAPLFVQSSEVQRTVESVLHLQTTLHSLGIERAEDSDVEVTDLALRLAKMFCLMEQSASTRGAPEGGVAEAEAAAVDAALDTLNVSSTEDEEELASAQDVHDSGDDREDIDFEELAQQLGEEEDDGAGEVQAELNVAEDGDRDAGEDGSLGEDGTADDQPIAASQQQQQRFVATREAGERPQVAKCVSVPSRSNMVRLKRASINLTPITQEAEPVIVRAVAGEAASPAEQPVLVEEHSSGRRVIVHSPRRSHAKRTADAGMDEEDRELAELLEMGGSSDANGAHEVELDLDEAQGVEGIEELDSFLEESFREMDGALAQQLEISLERDVSADGAAADASDDAGGKGKGKEEAEAEHAGDALDADESEESSASDDEAEIPTASEDEDRDEDETIQKSTNSEASVPTFEPLSLVRVFRAAADALCDSTDEMAQHHLARDHWRRAVESRTLQELVARYLEFLIQHSKAVVHAGQVQVLFQQLLQRFMCRLQDGEEDPQLAVLKAPKVPAKLVQVDGRCWDAFYRDTVQHIRSVVL